MENSSTKPAVIKFREKRNGPVSIMATGVYSVVGNTHNVSFFYDNAQFTLGLSCDIITISRIGEDSYTLFLEQGKTHGMKVSTPFGEIEYSVTPVSIDFSEMPNGIEASFKYKITPSADGRPVNMYISCETEEF